MTTKERVYWYTENEAEICAAWEGGETARALADRYGVHERTMQEFIRSRRMRGTAAVRWRRELRGS